MRWIHLLLPVLILGACSPSTPDDVANAPREAVKAEAEPGSPMVPAPKITPPNTVPAGATQSRNPSQQILMRMTEAERALGMEQMMEAGRQSCGRVTRTFYQGTGPDGEVMWNFRCTNSGDWMVSIGADEEGETTILECSILQSLGSPCWKKFE